MLLTFAIDDIFSYDVADDGLVFTSLLNIIKEERNIRCKYILD